MPKLELYGTSTCPYTREMREWLEWNQLDFMEYDVETDGAALNRMRGLNGNSGAVPVLVEDGKVSQIGWEGRACYVGH